MAAKKKKVMKKAKPQKKVAKTVKKAIKSKKSAAPVKSAAPKKRPVEKAKSVERPATQLSSAQISKILTPLDDRLVVIPEAQATQTAGGIFIPTTVSGRPSRGQVLAIGRGRRTKKGKVLPLDVQVGDDVMFAEYSGTKLSLAGRDVLILREEDVLGIVT
jgi:chaperonin GroES